MQRKRQPECEDEPEVTFELEEAPRAQRGGRAGVAGAAAIAGAGLVSSASAADSEDSLDVFDQPDDPVDPAGDVPVTSFQSLAEGEPDPEFPPIDFGSGDERASGAAAAAADETFGASSDVGGGFVLEAPGADETFGAPDGELDPVPDTLTGDEHLGESLEQDEDTPEDIDLS